MNRVMRIIKPVVRFFDHTWLGKTITITLAVLLGVVIISYAQAEAINKIHEKILAQYTNMNCIQVWKQMKRGDEI